MPSGSVGRRKPKIRWKTLWLGLMNGELGEPKQIPLSKITRKNLPFSRREGTTQLQRLLSRLWGEVILRCWGSGLRLTLPFSHFILDLTIRLRYNMSMMKQTIKSATITKSGKGYLATIRQGRTPQVYSFPTKNAARSFLRRNFQTATGTYN